MRIMGLTILCFVVLGTANAQSPRNDTSAIRTLDSIIVTSSVRLNHAPFLKPVEGINLFAGKKSNSVLLDPAKMNLTSNNQRTLFLQIPGLTLWEMNGAGTQINMGSRGTDAHRSIEMNMRQNGYNINSDVFGYPEAHYTPAMQGVQRVQLIRGSAALQFGPQFGGMLNYVMKEADTTKALSVEAEQTAGSFNFFNSFISISGKKGKWNYYVYYNDRRGDGWRKNSSFLYQSYYADLEYAISPKCEVSFQFSRMNYREQIAGGLTDEQFARDSRTALRSRNFFSPIINLPAMIFKSQLSPDTRLEVTSHLINGQRNSVQFLNPPNIPDTVNISLGTFNPRQVDRDYYNGFTVEGRFLHNYSVGNKKNTLSTGVRFFAQTTKRRQKGSGTAGTDFDLSLTKAYGIDLRLKTTNYAMFAENFFQVNDKLSFVPGFRLEYIHTQMNGLIENATVPVSYKSNRAFPLFGTGMEYALCNQTQVYANISQAYRPFLYSNVTPADRIDIVDPSLKDSKGYDIDIGYRGQIDESVKFDLSGYYVFYGNRVGQLTLNNELGNSYLFTTNIGDALSKGIEGYISFSFARLFLPNYTSAKLYRLRLFNSMSFSHATYKQAQISKEGQNVSLDGKRVENTPRFKNSTGVAWQLRTFLTQLTYTFVGKSFSDANNTVFNASGATGVVPSYGVWDFSMNFRFLKNFQLSAGINNLTNAKYFNRRISMYPGPGILPADGRSFYASLGLRI
jgi:Fe(3+) dicitrate transport protein